MRALTGFVLVALAVALGCGGSGATTTTAPPSTTVTTLAPTTTTPVGSSDVQAARAQLQTDVAALKASPRGSACPEPELDQGRPDRRPGQHPALLGRGDSSLLP